MDKISAAIRSRVMQAVGKRDTAPELAVRRLLHGLGYRYALHIPTLPGSPDIGFLKRRKVVFVHGCFWHGHDCRPSLRPRSRESYWKPKIERNRGRDARNLAALKELGWNVLVIWECETTPRGTPALVTKLQSFLGPPRHSPPDSPVPDKGKGAVPAKP